MLAYWKVHPNFSILPQSYRFLEPIILKCFAHNIWFDNIRFWSGLQTQMESSFAFQSLLSMGGVFANGDFVKV